MTCPNSSMKMKKTILLAGVLVILFSGCKKSRDYVLYYPLKQHFWARFNKLQFEIPLQPSLKGWDIYFFARHTKDYPFNNLDFNMIMNTPSGEERIREYHFEIKRKNGEFTGECTNDSCTATIALKKEIYLPEKGVLRLEFENLVPRLEVNGLLGVGIRMHPRG
jgi:gliding motility-associated lipoprotein GldH